MNTGELTTEQKIAFKQQLYNVCNEMIQQRIATIKYAMQSAQESANSEEKSSAGDKYETGRAMNHLAQEMNAAQLEDANNLATQLSVTDVTRLYEQAAQGSVVVTKRFICFIACGLGAVEISGNKIMALSAAAPVAQLMLKKKKGESFLQNGVATEIQDVF